LIAAVMSAANAGDCRSAVTDDVSKGLSTIVVVVAAYPIEAAVGVKLGA
jgi:hypothetical protein